MGYKVDTPLDAVAQRTADRMQTIARAISGYGTDAEYWAAMRRNCPAAVNAAARANSYFSAILAEEQARA